FASEMKALINLGVPKEIDNASLYTYLQLNYIPGPHSIFKGVKKLEPGSYLKLKIQNVELRIEKYFEVPKPGNESTALSYENAQKEVYLLMDASVQRRLVADVPLG